MANNEFNLPIDSHMSPRMPMPVSQQNMIEEFRRKRQEVIEATFLRTHQDYHSTPCPKPPMNYHHILANHEPTSHHTPSNQNQMPQFSPQFTGYYPSYARIPPPYPYVRIPPPMPPIYVHSMPSLMQCLPQQLPPVMATTVTPIPIGSRTVPPINYMDGCLGFSRDNTSMQNKISASGQMTPWQVPPEAQRNTFNTYCHMNMTVSTSTYGVGGASTSNVAAQGGVSFHCPYNSPRVAFQCSSMPPVVNSSSPCATSIILPDHILPEVEEIISNTRASGVANDNGGNNPDNAIDVSDGQQHQEEETIASHDLNGMHGNLCAEVPSATSMGEGNYDLDWDEFEITAFFEDIMIDDDPALLSDTTSTGELLLLDSDMPDLKEFGDGMISNTRTNNRCG